MQQIFDNSNCNIKNWYRMIETVGCHRFKHWMVQIARKRINIKQLRL